MIVLPANMKPAELHFMRGAASGVCAIMIGNAYAEITIILVMKAHNSIHRPLYGSDMYESVTHLREISTGIGDRT